jgi:hypothetical protein
VCSQTHIRSGAVAVKNFMKPVTEGRKKRLGVQGDTSRADVKEYPKNDSTRELIRRAIEDCMLFEALNDEVIDVLIGSMHPQTAQVRRLDQIFFWHTRTILSDNHDAIVDPLPLLCYRWESRSSSRATPRLSTSMCWRRAK